MEKIFVLLGLAIVCFLLVALIEEDLHRKFSKLGKFNTMNFSDFVKKVRNPNERIHKDGFIIARWSTSNFIKNSFFITLIFDENGNFVKCYEQGFGGGQTITPIIMVSI
jgi:hypothetical protein